MKTKRIFNISCLLGFFICSNFLVFERASKRNIIANAFFEKEQENDENFIDENRDFDESKIIVYFTEEYSKTLEKNDCYLLDDLYNFNNNLDIENAKCIADINEYNQKIAFSIPLKNPGKENVLSTIRDMNKLDWVFISEPNYFNNFMYNPSDALIDKQWPVSNDYYEIGLKKAWDVTRGNKRVRVGIIDCGISNHEDLVGNLEKGYDFQNNNEITNDPISQHGTEVAGIIGAMQNSIGISGVCPNVSMVPLQCEYGNRGCNLDSAIAAISYATDLWGTEKQISILNYSLEGFGTEKSLLTAVKSFPGLFVIAAGNDNNCLDDYTLIEQWNGIDNMISVGAMSHGFKKANFSNFGQCVSIYAPGEYLISTKGKNEYEIDIKGTSFAAPHVAGTAALLLSKMPNLSAKQLKNIIVDSAKNISINTKYGQYNVKCLAVDKALSMTSLNSFSLNYAYLRIGIVGKNGGTYKVKLINDNLKDVHVCYNRKMCFRYDAEDFNGLKHIEEINIPSCSDTVVEISENGTAGYIAAAITYTNGSVGYRLISYTNELKYRNNTGSTNRVQNVHQTQNIKFNSIGTKTYPVPLKLSVIERKGNIFKYTYTIKITNPNLYAVQIGYNTKMCFEGDAKSFNVSNEKIISINKNSSSDVIIEGNGMAGFITASIRFSAYGFDIRKITYANNLGNKSIGTNRNSLVRYEFKGAYVYE